MERIFSIGWAKVLRTRASRAPSPLAFARSVEPGSHPAPTMPSLTDLILGPCYLALPRSGNGGGSWIRTSVGRSPADLQSALVGHLSILPDKEGGKSSLLRSTARIFFTGLAPHFHALNGGLSYPRLVCFALGTASRGRCLVHGARFCFMPFECCVGHSDPAPLQFATICVIRG